MTLTLTAPWGYGCQSRKEGTTWCEKARRRRGIQFRRVPERAPRCEKKRPALYNQSSEKREGDSSIIMWKGKGERCLPKGRRFEAGDRVAP